MNNYTAVNPIPTGIPNINSQKGQGSTINVLSPSSKIKEKKPKKKKLKDSDEYDRKIHDIINNIDKNYAVNHNTLAFIHSIESTLGNFTKSFLNILIGQHNSILIENKYQQLYPCFWKQLISVISAASNVHAKIAELIEVFVLTRGKIIC
jgi:hypothetical protein